MGEARRCQLRLIILKTQPQTSRFVPFCYIAIASQPLRENEDSLCQMIFKKIALPDGVTKKVYWEALILGITNDKMCSLQSNFKQDLFEQFQGSL
jgi:hypothetical protein